MKEAANAEANIPNNPVGAANSMKHILKNKLVKSLTGMHSSNE